MSTVDKVTWKIWIDTGGTFTDCVATDPRGVKSRAKILSSGRLRGRVISKIARFQYSFETPWAYDGALLEGYSFQIEGLDLSVKIVKIDFLLKKITLSEDLPPTDQVDFEIFTGEEAPVLAARLLTKTSLKDRFPPMEMRLGTTKGTNALLERKGAKTLLVVTKGYKDLLYIGNQQRPALFQLDIPEPNVLHSQVLETDGRLDSSGNILSDPDLPFLMPPHSENYESVAISLLHAYKNGAHEAEAASHFKETGARYVSTSSNLFPFSHYLRRTQTVVVNAYLEPVLDEYLSRIRQSLGEARLKIMTSTGSLAEMSGFRAKDSLLSGPAGGIVASVNVARRFGFRKILTFDMGGTSTDTACMNEEPELKYITEIDGIEFHNPALSIETVAAGGGSICWFDDFSLRVGPESAGATPGPACYGAGGPLTITDVNLLLGKLDASRFGIPIRPEFAIEALKNLQNQILTHTTNLLSLHEILLGLERIANEKMADAVRKISIEKGIAPSEYTMITFGGAGGLHSCQLCDLLDIENVIIPYDAGLFSAVGIGEALISVIASKQILLPWTEAEPEVALWIDALLANAVKELSLQGISEYEVAFCSVFLRFAGQENTIEIPYQVQESLTEFRKQYATQFGYFPENLAVELESIRIKVQETALEIIPAQPRQNGTPTSALRQISPLIETGSAIPTSAGVYEWDLLIPGAQISGPSVLLNNTSTTFIPEGWKVIIQDNLDAIAFKTFGQINPSAQHSEEVALQLFTNRFKAIADEMGVQLQRTAFSVNVKERLDFSCALLDSNCELLVNAQHIPVHLGSMGICARLVREAITIGPGDVIITNHPKYGGSHLPDITLLAGVFTDAQECVGYVINRAHHAEIGGKTPGSMPPDAVCLAEEGAVIPPSYFVKSGEIQWTAIRRLFLECAYPTRSFSSNEADMIAALSALRKGSQQLMRLVENHGLPAVKHYMGLLKTGAIRQLDNALIPLHGKSFEAVEYMDDGHRISVKIAIWPEKQIFDFTGTSSVHPNNLNASVSILYSVILYVLRLLVNKEIPLNDGLMKNVEIILPENSFLNPIFSDDPLLCPAVVGGNTEVSQRLVDTLLKAFGLAACSQGTMNNFLFGNENFGYYETIGGGAGAGPGFNGRSAVHQHMTNTRITDPEELERKYPVRLLEFGIRKNSGGKGDFLGGDGIVRTLEFLKPLQVTLLTQHRKYAPYGLAGGSEGSPGNHTLTTADGLVTDLPGVCSIKVAGGDILTIETPGGGGYGMPGTKNLM